MLVTVTTPQTLPVPGTTASPSPGAHMSQESGGNIDFPSLAVPLHHDRPAVSGRPDFTALEPLPATDKSASKSKPLSRKGKAKDLNAQTGRPVKPKLSKSRNGCLTCKQKRLKCDETKPSCQQCAKRGVSCGGYKKNFKWRPFEEASFSIRGPPLFKGKGKDGTSNLLAELSSPQHGPSTANSPETSSETPSKNPSHSPPSKYATPATSRGSPPRSVPQAGIDHRGMLSHPTVIAQVSRSSTQPNTESSDSEHTLASTSGLGYGEPQPYRDLEDKFKSDLYPASSMDGSNLLNQQVPSSKYYPEAESDGFDDVEEIIPDNGTEKWAMIPTEFFPFDPDQSDFRILAPLLGQPKLHNDSAEMLLGNFSKATCGILSIRDGPHENPWRTTILPLIHESEALYHALAAVTAFHNTRLHPSMKRIGVEHIRRSAQLLARDIQHMRTDIALTLTLVLAFAESWDVHVTTGIKHLQGAKHFLHHAMPMVQQLDPSHPFAQRIRFLRNTWVYADVIARLTSLDADDSTDFDAAYDADATFDMDRSGNPRIEIDPLMGCAASLFPLIGRAANIVAQVRRSVRNTMQLGDQAQEIQAALLQWSPPMVLIEPEDGTCAAVDAVRTAESYRWATLLYLHQAVPELASLPGSELARNALTQVALVPPRSHTTIVQIYPLLAGGCEVQHPADREWVVGRWMSMVQRMLVGNVDRCLEVVREVWARRDEADRLAMRGHKPPPVPQSWDLAALENVAIAQHADNAAFAEGAEPRAFYTGGTVPPYGPSSNSPLGHNNFPYRSRLPDPPTTPYQSEAAVRAQLLPVQRTVRGKQHWIGVMEDWNWEVLLG